MDGVKVRRGGLRRAVGKHRSGFAAVNGTRLWVEADGAGSPLVLIHGSPLDARMWEPQIAPLAQVHRVIRYDVRGYGRSDPPATIPYRHEDDLEALLGCMEVERAAMLGLSMGGRLAVDFALAYPTRVSALILAGSSVSGYPWTDDLDAMAAATQAAIARGGVAAAQALTLEEPLLQPSLREAEVRRALAAQVQTYSGWHWLHDDPVIAPQPPAYTRLEDVSAPTLVITGEHDQRDIHGIAAALASRIPGATSFPIPGAAHMVNLEAPDEFNDAVLAFLARESHAKDAPAHGGIGQGQ